MKHQRPPKRDHKPKVSFNEIEDQLRKALNGSNDEPQLPLPTDTIPPPPARRTKDRPQPHKHSITITYSVRHSWGGRCFKFAHTENTINEFDCKMKAEAAMRKNGYVDAIVLDVVKT